MSAILSLREKAGFLVVGFWQITSGWYLLNVVPMSSQSVLPKLPHPIFSVPLMEKTWWLKTPKVEFPKV